MRIQTIVSIAAVLVGFGCHQPTARAAAYIYNFGSVFAGGTPASARPPWLAAEFIDVAPGKVQVTFTAANLTGRENVRDFYLNLNPALNPCLLVFNRINSVGYFKDPKIGVGSNAFRAGNSGEYDIRFQFGCGLGNGRAFGAGDRVTYLISGIPGLSAASFDFTSVRNCQTGPFFAASQVRGIAPRNGTGWIYPAEGLVTVPEPATPLLFGSALALLGALRMWRRRSR